jgi:hypothetical protein
MGIYPFIRDCRNEEERNQKKFDQDLFCQGTVSSLDLTMPGSIDCACVKHRLIRGNKFIYDLSRFYIDHKVKNQICHIEVEFIRYTKLKHKSYTIKVAQLLVNIDLSYIKNIRYYTCFENNKDISSIVKEPDGKFLITLPFTQMSIISTRMTHEDHIQYYETREKEKEKEFLIDTPVSKVIVNSEKIKEGWKSTYHEAILLIKNY